MRSCASAFVLCRDAELSKDLVQDALIRTHARWHKVDSPDAYVRKAIVNDFLSWRRRRASREITTDQLPELSVEPGHSEDRDAMWRVLATLPRQQRAVLVLRFYEGLEDGAISHALGCSSATVRSHASKALATLRAGDAISHYAEGSAR